MYIQINQSVPLFNTSTPISSCVAKIKRQRTEPMDNGNTMQIVEVSYFESGQFGVDVSWSDFHALNTKMDVGIGEVHRTYNIERTSAELDLGITTSSLYNDIRDKMISHGFDGANLIIV